MRIGRTDAPEALARRGDAMLQITLGTVMVFVIGAACRWFDIRSLAPPKVVGALLVVAGIGAARSLVSAAPGTDAGPSAEQAATYPGRAPTDPPLETSS